MSASGTRPTGVLSRSRVVSAAAVMALLATVAVSSPATPGRSGPALIGSAGERQHQRPPEESIIRLETQKVTLPDFPAEGLILDIGGGGEGVIGQLKGEQVVAVDLSKRELEEAPGGPLLKIVMDARSLGFLDNTFPTTTVFFTFMYIPAGDHAKVLAELFRVLVPGGRLLIWDGEFPQARDAVKKFALFPLTVRLPDRQIDTGYGVPLPEHGTQGLDHYLELASKTGFDVVAQDKEQSWFYLELRKTGR